MLIKTHYPLKLSAIAGTKTFSTSSDFISSSSIGIGSCLIVMTFFIFPSLKAQCDTSRWKANWAVDVDSTSPVLGASSFISNGILKVPISLSSITSCLNSDGSGCPKSFIEFKDTMCITNNFSFEVRLKNPKPDGILAYDTYIEILSSGGMSSGCQLMGDAGAQYFDNAFAGNQSKGNVPGLVLDLSNWTTIKLEYLNNVLHYSQDGTEFYQLPYNGNICNILGFVFAFKGSGSIDWIKITDGGGNACLRRRV